MKKLYYVLTIIIPILAIFSSFYIPEIRDALGVGPGSTAGAADLQGSATQSDLGNRIEDRESQASPSDPEKNQENSVDESASIEADEDLPESNVEYLNETGVEEPPEYMAIVHSNEHMADAIEFVRELKRKGCVFNCRVYYSHNTEKDNYYYIVTLGGYTSRTEANRRKEQVVDKRLVTDAFVLKPRFIIREVYPSKVDLRN